METFEFLVTSTAMVTLQEHIKIQAQDLDDAIAKSMKSLIMMRYMR